MSEPRHYTISLEVEVSDQDDLKHFRPDSVTGRIPQLGLEWASGNDAEALRDFFAFFIKWSLATGTYSDGIREIADRALLAR